MFDEVGVVIQLAVEEGGLTNNMVVLDSLLLLCKYAAYDAAGGSH
jgi:hypothetical protein